MKISKFFGKRSKVAKAKTIQDIAIFGFADAQERGHLFKDVKNVAKKLAEAGYTVVDGGGPGVMRAATVGAKEGGGQVIGITLYDEDIPNFEGKDPKNLFDKEIKTRTYVERTLALMKEGQIYIVFNGGTGTLSEFGMAWGIAHLYFGHHKPIILYGKFWRKVIKSINEEMLLRPHDLEILKIVDSPDEVLRAINKFEEEIEKSEHKHIKAEKSDFSI